VHTRPDRDLDGRLMWRWLLFWFVIGLILWALVIWALAH
jgi:hypothetical protein